MEVAWTRNVLDHILVNRLQEMPLLDGSGQTLNSSGGAMTMADVSQSALSSSTMANFVLLMTLFEGFFQELLKMDIDPTADEYSPAMLRNEISTFAQTAKQGGTWGSTSLYNVSFVDYVLTSRYGIDLEEIKRKWPLLWEAGMVRQVWVHSRGRMTPFQMGCLTSTLQHLDNPNDLTIVDNTMFMHYKEGFQEMLDVLEASAHGV
ncbi:hypothetical protein HDU85_006106 [Gaertneriomyces sp. JEL0708]|nr:hypothetical protein HDU85_006106 [Gaertneriomyces sp. JEL0708]